MIKYLYMNPEQSDDGFEYISSKVNCWCSVWKMENLLDEIPEMNNGGTVG